MAYGRMVRQAMVGISHYPHISHWLELGHAMKIARLSFQDADKYFVPMTMLVLDESYGLVGTLNLKDILEKIQLTKASRELWESPVGKIMTPARIFAKPDEPVTKAASLMLENNLDLLPVSDEGNKLVGLIRIMDIYDELIDAVSTNDRRNNES